jgi:periplasmic divalent cation tolerance protein
VKLLLTNISPDAAGPLARTLVEERLAACVNLLPIRSVYRWDGAICDEAETTLLMKVPADGVERAVARVRELHPYRLPEILVLPVDVSLSHAPYVAWVRSECAP